MADPSSIRPSEQKRFARPARDLLWGGLTETVLAIVFGVIALTTTRHPAATAAGLAFEALFFGGFMWWFTGARQQEEVEHAAPVLDPEIRDARAAAGRLAITSIAAIAVLTFLTILSPASPIAAGIMLGGGAYAFGLHRWLVRWEAEHAVEVLRVPAWRRRKGVNDYRFIHLASR